MNPQGEWTPAQWFEEAARCYLEGHQACPWCGGSHRVFRSERGGLLDYYCNCCDFYVCHEPRTHQYHAVLGQKEMCVVSPPVGSYQPS